MIQTIELDCAPGGIRPGYLYPDVIKGLNLPEREPVSKFFGNWVWDYSDLDPEFWRSIQGVLKQRIETLYNQGFIRYGSW